VDRGAKPNTKSKFGNTAIDYAKMNNHLKVAQYMQVLKGH
jgi:ankyrin repeat protein